MEQKTAEYTLMKSPFTYLISYFSVDSVLLHSYQNNSSALTVSDTQRPDNSWIEDHSAPISPPTTTTYGKVEEDEEEGHVFILGLIPY